MRKHFTTKASYSCLRYSLYGSCLCLLTFPFIATAQNREPELLLEEVVVTATKREVSLLDAPLSVSVINGEKIESHGMTELEDLTLHVPNVHIAEGGAGTQIFIRGIGSGINYGFEQSVGIFVDGVYFGRGRSARSKFLDLERVEILKGPQSTLFGKNTIAGAVNITTRRPTDYFESYADASYQTVFSGKTIKTVVSGEVLENVLGRVIVKVHKDEGYVENTYTSDDGPQEESWSARFSLDWSLSDDIELMFKLEHSDHDVLGRQDMISIASDSAITQYQTYGDPNFEANFDYEKPSADLPGSKQFDNSASNILQLTADYQWGELNLKSITAYTDYEFKNILDTDYGPLLFVESRRHEKYDQSSQEFLLRSPLSDRLEYLIGIYYHASNLRNVRKFPVTFSALPPLESFLLTQINGALMTSLSSGSLDSSNIGSFDQDTEIVSTYAQLTWSHTEVFRTTFGIRYSNEKKEVRKSLLTTDTDEKPNAFLALVYDSVLGFSRDHNLNLERKEDSWTGNLNFQYDIQPETMLYLNLANGVKAGGFDEGEPFGNLNAAEFDDEKVETIELGAKMELWGGRSRLNVAWFHSDFEDVQVSTFNGDTSFIVGNAAESAVEGVELDFEMIVTEGINLYTAAAYLDAHYVSFVDAACNVFQITAAVAATGSRACQQDLSGKPLQFSPNWSVNVSVTYEDWVLSDYKYSVSLNVNWVDDTVVANDLDPNMIQESHYKVSAFAQIASVKDQWDMALVVKNLNNEKTFSWGNDVPLGSLGFDFTYFHHIDPPRTVEVQARYHF